jgi:hypothetical protein
MARPRMIVVAGPPGSGKTRYFPVTAFGVDSFNIDDRCAQILGSYRAIPRDVRRAVAKECERFVLDHIENGKSFAVETTLRTTAAIEQAELARKSDRILRPRRKYRPVPEERGRASGRRLACRATLGHVLQMTFSDDPRIAVWQREMARIDANEPPPNSDAPPKRHHYVPEMYLRRFAVQMGRKGVPRVTRIEAKAGPKSSIVIGVRDAAVETDFYNIETDDPRRVHEAEHIIGVFERAAGYAFATLDRLGSGHFPDDVDRENLAMFMALQFVRGHDTGDFQTRIYTQTSRMIMRVAASSPEYVRNFLKERGEDASDEAVAKAAATFREAAKTVLVTPHKNETVEAVLRGPIDFMPYFFKRRWILARSPIPFLTSDRPVVLLERHDPKEAWRGVGLGTADAIVYPLDRRRALIMRHPDPELGEGIVDIDAGFARKLNVAVADRARRWIFHHPNDKPLDGVPFNPKPKTQGPAPAR